MASSIAFGSNSYNDSNNAVLALTNGSNQTGQISLLCDPSDSFSLSWVTSFSSNYNSLSCSFTDCNYSYTFGLGLSASNAFLSFNSNVYYSSNTLGNLVANSNNSITLYKTPSTISVATNGSNLFSHITSPCNVYLDAGVINFGGFSGNGKYASIEPIAYLPIESFLVPVSFYQSVIFQSNVYFASNTNISSQLAWTSNAVASNAFSPALSFE